MEEQIYKLRKLLEELESIKGRHTELVSVYIPAGFNLHEIINMLKQEYTLTENVKNKTVRNNVLGAIDKILQELKFYAKTPENGLVLFAGNVSETEGQVDIKVWTIEPTEPLKIKKYWCDQKFELEPLQEMVAEKELYGLVILDTKEASIGLLKGKKIELLRKLGSIVPGSFRKGGQCTSLETLIPLSNGNIIKIGDIKNHTELKSVDFNTFSILDSSILDIYKTEKSIVYKIITKYPRLEIETSKDHFFFVWENGDIIEKPAEELKIGDILLMPEKINVKGEIQKLNTNYYFKFKISDEGRKFLIQRRKELDLSQRKLAKKLNVLSSAISAIELGRRKIDLSRKQSNLIQKICKEISVDFNDFKNKFIIPNETITLPEILNVDLAQIIGYFIGDGNYDKNRIVFSEGNKELAEYYSNKIKNLFNVKVHQRYRRKKKYYEIRIYSKTIENFFRQEFIKNKDSLNITIPEKILKSSEKVVSAFLKGLFDAEGYVSSDKVALGINNKILAQQVQLCLLRFSILSSFLRYDNRRNPYSKNYRYTIDITEKESLIKFKNLIGFSFKNKKIDEIIIRMSDCDRIRRVLPAGVKIRNLLEKYSVKRKDFWGVSKFLHDKRFMSKAIFKKSILSKVNNEELYSDLKWLLDCQLLPIIVKKIEKYEKLTPMIDLAVKHENFIANGILVHNSSQRLERVREGLINDWYKIIAENVRNHFSKFILKGIILGGPGPAKNDFFDGAYLLTNIKKQVLGVKNVGYTDEQGLEELVERSQDILAEAAVAKEKALLQKFFEELGKDSGLVVYGKEKVIKALELGTVEIILISEGLNVEEFVEKAKQYGTTVEIISKDTREGGQLFQLGGIAAILRWKM